VGDLDPEVANEVLVLNIGKENFILGWIVIPNGKRDQQPEDKEEQA